MSMRPREDVAKALADWHFAAESSLKEIIWVSKNDPADQPIRLLEVTSEPSSWGDDNVIDVFGFTPAKDVPYPSEVAEITERQWVLIQAGLLALPEGWRKDESIRFTRPSPSQDQEGER